MDLKHKQSTLKKKTKQQQREATAESYSYMLVHLLVLSN